MASKWTYFVQNRASKFWGHPRAYPLTREELGRALSWETGKTKVVPWSEYLTQIGLGKEAPQWFAKRIKKKISIKTEKIKPLPDIEMKELLLAFKDVLKQVDRQKHHEIEREEISIRERMTHVLSKLDGDNFVEFQDLFTLKEGRLGIVVTLMAILELLKLKVIDMVQAEAFAPIYLKPVSSVEDE